MMENLHFLPRLGVSLCLDIGSGTQDVLLAIPGLEEENWPQFVLPSPAKQIAARIEALTAAQKHIWLYGNNMGGGFGRALKKHIEAGLSVCATQQASLAIHDNPVVLRHMGVDEAERCPANHVPIYLADYNASFWESLLKQMGLPLPDRVLAAAQDHGHHIEGNREGRMRAWRELLQHSSSPEHWLYENVPPSLTRLRVLQGQTGGIVADTGTAAVLGLLSEPEIMERSFRQGITFVNVGNGHTIAMLLYRGEVRGIFEHHTGMRTQEEYLEDLKEFRLSWLPDEQVRATGGHGTAFAPFCEEAGDYLPTFLLGPKRSFLQGHGQYCAPHGNMMLAGCYGLLYGCLRTVAVV